MEVQKQYNFYDLSTSYHGVPVEILDDEHTIISSIYLREIDLQMKDKSLQAITKYKIYNYKLNKDLYTVILYSEARHPNKPLDWSRPEMQDLACAVWANDHIYIDNLIYHTCSLEMYNYAQMFFSKDSIILH